MTMRRRIGGGCLGLLVGLWIGGGGAAEAQDRLKGVPGHAKYEEVGREPDAMIKGGELDVNWVDGGKAFEFYKGGKGYRYDLAARKATEAKLAAPERPNRRSRRRNRAGDLARGRQADSAPAPDGTLKATYRDRNLFLSDPNGLIEAQITTDGTEKDRTKNGKASWVYGEELYQQTAFWWSPDSKKLAYYRFDESKVADYYLQLDQTKVQDRLDVEPYPKAGTPNPVVDLFIHDLKAKKATRVDLRDGKALADDVVGYYAWNVRWSPDGKELLFHRTNRRQNILELAATDPDTGRCRAVVREEWPESWVENNPETHVLKDGKRFLWASQRNGWKNYYLYDFAKGLLHPITAHEFEAARIVRVDEEAGVLDYMAHDGDNPMKLQLHRVKLDGTGDRRLTDPSLHHAVDVAPDGKTFIDVAQAHDVPPSTRLVDAAEGEVVETLGENDMGPIRSLGLKPIELFTYKAADGQTELHGRLHKPSTFDPSTRYPVLASVYAGPETNGATENFDVPSRLTELGFLVVELDARSASGRGKRFLDAIYLKLGQVEIDDLAAGIKSLRDRPFVDPSRVGIFGTSYGGYASLLALLRHPDVFAAACASSPVTDYRHYDTIYTERYLRTPQENPSGYDGGSAVLKAADLKGRLMVYYGTADDNVHPSNTLQLAGALARARKSFDLQVGADQGHSSIPRDRMMEFFVEALAKPSEVKP